MARQKLGQHFLADRTWRKKILETLGVAENDVWIEIGAGHGEMTSLLASRARQVIAIEIHPPLARRLAETTAPLGNVRVVSGDVLELDLAALMSAACDERVHVYGNLPYYITSDILLRLFRFHASIERAVVMVQREVAVRIAAQPGTSDYGVLSATTQMYARVESLLTLPPEAFSPPPQVHSTVLRLTMAPRFHHLQVAPDEFLAFLRTCFAQKRKMLSRNLRNAGHDAPAIAAALQACGISPQARAEGVDLTRMACLFRSLR